MNFSIAVSALRTIFDRQAVAASNVANVSTPGFSASRQLVESLLAGGVRTAAIQRDFSPGPLEPTGRALDLAVAGPAFLAVDTPRGMRYARTGSFGLDADGQIVDAAGNRLLPGLRVPAGAVEVNVAGDGTVSASMPDGSTAAVGTLRLYSFTNPGGLLALGGGLYAPTPASGAPVAGSPGTPGFGELVAGYLEGSNVNLASEMTGQIVNRAALGANLASIRAADRMLGELLDTVG